MPRHPNLLYILVDQMRYHAMGCAGNTQVRTPNLDRMATEGVCCDLAVSNIPVCTPARASILTGLYPLAHTTITNNSMLPNDMPSMGKMLKAHGYATGYIGKWHLAGEAYIGKTPQNGGQEGWIPPGEMRHGFDYWAVHHCTHAYRKAHYYRDTPEPISAGEWEPDTQTDLAIKFMREHTESNPEQPFGLVVSLGTPHTPFTAPEEFTDLYKPDELELRQNVAFDELIRHNDDASFSDPNRGIEELLRGMLANYYGAISNIDYNMGRLFRQLDELGIANNTLVVFTSDHGELLGSHGQMHKSAPYDESILIPFLARQPGVIRAGTKIDHPFGLADHLPTLFSLMGLELEAPVEGVDFSPVFRGGDADLPASTPLIWPINAVTWGKEWNLTNTRRGKPADFMRIYRGIRTRTHTYVRDREEPWLLFDNEADPYQMNNLIETCGPDAVPAELEAELSSWLERTRDPFEDAQYYIDRIDLETGLATRPEEFRRSGTQ